MANARGFLAELKRRNVLRAGALYAAGVWAFGQGLSQFSPALGLPDDTTRWFLVAAAVGFPLWLVFAWFYEFTPQGFRRDSEIAQDAPTRHSNARRLEFAIIGVLAVAVVLLLTNTLVWHKGAGLQPDTATAIPAKSIAVLPFENLNVEKKDAYFVVGMQDLILTKLADIGELKVISRTSTMQYQSRPRDLKAIALQLGVATLLEGSVQKAGNQVLINVQLIDAKSDAHIWAQSYQRTLDNVFEVEGAVAEKIATALKAKLSPTESKRLATGLSANSTANDTFLRAEYFTNRGNVNYDTADWKAAIPLYQQAIALDPKFAQARARLSVVESTLAFFGGGGESVEQLTADARTQAERAVSLAPDLPAAHLAVGYTDYWGKGDYAAALKAFAAASALSPNDTKAMAAQGYVLRRQSHFNAAIDSFKKAITLDPRNSSLAFELGQTYMLASRYREAAQALQQALAIDPQNVQAKNRYALSILFGSGDMARALAAIPGKNPFLQSQRVQLLTWQRHYRAALTLLEGIPDTPDNFQPPNPSKTLLQADLYRLMGDHARAQPLFQKALPEVRAQLAAQAGSDINLSMVWTNVADAELGLGHTAAGLAAIGKAQALVERSGDHVYGPVQMQGNAALYAVAGRVDLAVPLLAKALATPGIGANYSPVLLWIDPVWDPIRKDPGFRALLKKYAKYKPASTTATASIATGG